MKNEIAGVANEKEKGRGVEGPEAADISSHTLNFRFWCWNGKPRRLIHVRYQMTYLVLHRVTTFFLKKDPVALCLLHGRFNCPETMVSWMGSDVVQLRVWVVLYL